MESLRPYARLLALSLLLIVSSACSDDDSPAGGPSAGSTAGAGTAGFGAGAGGKGTAGTGGKGAAGASSAQGAGKGGAGSSAAGSGGKAASSPAGAGGAGGQESDADGGTEPAKGLAKLNHLVVIYLENHSFDNLYGSYAGAEGLAASSAKIPQIDATNSMPFDMLPQVDPNVPTDLDNASFDITQFVPQNQKTIDLVHRYYQEQMQIDGGKMDMFVTVSDAKGLSLGYYPTAMLPLAQKIGSMSGQVTVLDHFFHAAFGGSFLNHHWLIAAASPTFPNAPDAMVAKLDANGKLVTDGAVTPDGFAVNTSYSVNAPHPAGTDTSNLVPNQTNPTIGDRLSDKAIDWAWYSGGWNDALAGNPDATFQFHHQPFIYYAKYADGTDAKKAHLKDETDFVAAAKSGKLPPVSFVKPLGINNEHPGYADLATGEQHVVDLVDTLMGGPTWNDTAIIITYDENGGFFDHVAPPVVDKWGPGTRVPAIVISPFAAGGVDATAYDTTAILKLIEKRWSVDALGARDAAQPDLSEHALKFE